METHIPEGVQLEAEGLSLFHRGKIFCRVSPSFQPQRLFSSFLRITLGWTKEMSIQKAHPREIISITIARTTKNTYIDKNAGLNVLETL